MTDEEMNKQWVLSEARKVKQLYESRFPGKKNYISEEVARKALRTMGFKEIQERVYGRGSERAWLTRIEDEIISTLGTGSKENRWVKTTPEKKWHLSFT